MMKMKRYVVWFIAIRLFILVKTYSKFLFSFSRFKHISFTRLLQLLINRKNLFLQATKLSKFEPSQYIYILHSRDDNNNSKNTHYIYSVDGGQTDAITRVASCSFFFVVPPPYYPPSPGGKKIVTYCKKEFSIGGSFLLLLSRRDRSNLLKLYIYHFRCSE